VPASETRAELERLGQALATVREQEAFLELLDALGDLRRELLGTEMDGAALEGLMRIDREVFRRTRRGVRVFSAPGMAGLAWLTLLCLPWPLLTGITVALSLALLGDFRSWALGGAALFALYAARLGHELGHVLGGWPVFGLAGLYTSRNFGQLRLQMSVRRTCVGATHLVRLYLGGCLVNLALALGGLLAYATGVWTGIGALAFVGANLVLGLGNLLPVRGLSTDGYNALYTWRASHQKDFWTQKNADKR